MASATVPQSQTHFMQSDPYETWKQDIQTYKEQKNQY